MIAVVVGFLAVVLVGTIALHGPEHVAGQRKPEARRIETPRRVELPRLALAVAVLAGTFFLHLALITLSARSQRPIPAWLANLPLLPIDDRGPRFGHAPLWSSAAACTLAETIALWAVYRTGRQRRFGRRASVVVVLGAALMIVAAFFTPALTSFDMFAYVGSEHVPDPYHPPSVAFSGDFRAINYVYGVPIFPSPYGPVWLALARIAVFPFASLGAQLRALRLLGALCLIASVFAIRALRFGAAEVSLIALNPALIIDFVLDGHNDVTAIALALWALALGTRLPAAGVILGALAGGVKLPFLAIGTLAAAGAKSPAARLTGAALVVAGGVALSAALGGRDYLQAIRTTARLYSAALADPLVNGAHAVLALAALAAVGCAIVARRSWPTASWAFAALAAAFFGWYVAWGLPYAAYERRWLAAFALSLPPLTFLLATFYASSSLLNLTLMSAIIGAPVATYAALRRTRRSR